MVPLSVTLNDPNAGFKVTASDIKFKCVENRTINGHGYSLSVLTAIFQTNLG